ncbi:ABC transporter ATP-binding protein [Hyphomonas pacifica]|uniref:ABC transporter n=1 Tax=Hyphomonas pacifica TaxID=1280941 RepID=A0A062TNE0_9PROT|nr:ABC transporter ATP-binding protein [Hyphomonas pacifica]KCZ46746.1 ABC transporter [Hyphomonas pacifica]RAN30364.1 ABC transporter [Hyphomonas pacifica]
MSETLTAKGISRRYGTSTVVQNVSLTLQPGEITALLGGSGAGKSTLLRLFAGLEPVDTGEIRLGDQLLSSPERTVPAEKRRIGLIFQDFALFPHLTAAQNVAFGLKSMGKEAARALAAEWLERLGLTGRAEAYPHELSGGEQQRVAIARALAPSPAAILMDEPFSGLDPALRGSVRDTALAAIREAGIPALLVTHDPTEALESADCIAILQGGTLLQQGEAAEIYMNPASAAVAASLGPVSRLKAEHLPEGLTGQAVPAGTELIVRPEGVLHDENSPARAKVLASQLTGPLCRLLLQCNGQALTALVPRTSAPKAGAEIGIRLDPALTFMFQSANT